METSFCVPTVYEGALWHLESEGNMNSLGVSCSYVSRRSTSHFTSPQIQALDVALLAKKTKFGKVTPKPLCWLGPPSRFPSLMNVEDLAFPTVLQEGGFFWSHLLEPQPDAYTSFCVSYAKTPSKSRTCFHTHYALDQVEFKKFLLLFFFKVKEVDTYKYHHEILK